MTITTALILDGFEHGVTGAGIITGGIAGLGWTAQAGTWSITTSNPRGAGAYGLRSFRSNPTTATGYIRQATAANEAILVGKFGIYFTTFPAANTPVITWHHNTQSDTQLRYNASRLQVNHSGGTVNSTNTITTGTWYLVEYRWNLSANPHTFDWRIDEVAQTSGSSAVAADSFWQFSLGPVAAATMDMQIDDFVMGDTSGDYPMGNSYITPLSPNGKGTHSFTAGDFDSTTNNGGAYTPVATTDDVSSILGIVPISGTTQWIRQDVLRTTAYLEHTLPDLPADAAVVNKVQGLLSYNAASTTANQGAAGAYRASDATYLAIFGNPTTRADFSNTALTYANALLTLNGDTPAEVNGLTIRIGYSGDVTPNPYWHQVLLQVDHTVSAGGATEAAAATIAAASTVTAATPTATVAIAATIAATSTVTATRPLGTVPGAASIAAAATVTATRPGATVPVAATAVATSTVTATRPLGTVPGAVTVAAASAVTATRPGATVPIAATAAATSTVTADLTETAGEAEAAAATINAVSGVTATRPNATVPIAAAAAGVSVLTATPAAATVPLAMAASATSTVTAAATLVLAGQRLWDDGSGRLWDDGSPRMWFTGVVTEAAAANVVAISTVTATLSSTVPVASTVAAASVVAATRPTATVPAAATIAATAAVIATRPLATVPGSTTIAATSTVTATRPLGAVAGASTIAGASTVTATRPTATVPIVSTVAATSAVTATRPLGAVPVASTVAATSTLTPATSPTEAAAAAIAATSSVTANVTAATALAAAIAARSHAGTEVTKMPVPLYVYPSFFGSDWDDLVANYPDSAALDYGLPGSGYATSLVNTQKGYHVIANPATGPGTSENSDYTARMTAAQAAGYAIIGYVNTWQSDGNVRPLGDVTDDIDGWYSIYEPVGVHIDGIFFDLLPTGLNGDQTGFVQDLVDHIRTNHDDPSPANYTQIVIGNFGTWPLAGGYISPLDIACVNENTLSGYLLSSVPEYASGYASTFPPNRLLHLVHGVDDIGEAQQAFDHAVDQGAGWFYASQSDGLWGELADYWADLDDLTTTSRATLTVAGALAAATVATSTVTGSLTVTSGLTATVVGSSAVTASTEAAPEFAAATITASSTVTANAGAAVRLATTITASSTLTAAVSAVVALAATTTATSATSAAAGATVALAATSAGSSTVTATATVTAPNIVPIAAAVTATSTVTATLAASVPGVAGVAGAATVTGTATAAVPVSAFATGTAAVIASAGLAGAGPETAANAVSSVTAALTVTSALAAAVAATSTVVATAPPVLGAVTAAAVATSTVVATLGAARAATATIEATSAGVSDARVVSRFEAESHLDGQSTVVADATISIGQGFGAVTTTWREAGHRATYVEEPDETVNANATYSEAGHRLTYREPSSTTDAHGDTTWADQGRTTYREMTVL